MPGEGVLGRDRRTSLTLQVLRVGCGRPSQQCVLASLSVAQFLLLSDKIVHLEKGEGNMKWWAIEAERRK